VEVKKIRVVQGGTSTTILNRTSLHIMDDVRRIATVHNWTTDTLEREINAQGELNTNKIRYQYGNHIDSASLELNSTGQIISYEEYFPYGDTSLIAGTSQKEVKLKEYRYTGKEKDDATGLYYYGARYYASWLGRWMSADLLFRENPAVYDRPKGKDAETSFRKKVYSEGLNLYEYCKGNPVKFNDLNGGETNVPRVVDGFKATQEVKKFEQKFSGVPDYSDQMHAHKSVQTPAGILEILNLGYFFNDTFGTASRTNKNEKAALTNIITYLIKEELKTSIKNNNMSNLSSEIIMNKLKTMLKNDFSNESSIKGSKPKAFLSWQSIINLS
jgi:RHS repeat-associated protein